MIAAVPSAARPKQVLHQCRYGAKRSAPLSVACGCSAIPGSASGSNDPTPPLCRNTSSVNDPSPRTGEFQTPSSIRIISSITATVPMVTTITIR